MSWNYRVIDHGDWFGLHEVYYNDGKPVSRTANPVTFLCDAEDGPEGIKSSLELALRAFEKPVLTVKDFGD